jgi:hypothetical protein
MPLRHDTTRGTSPAPSRDDAGWGREKRGERDCRASLAMTGTMDPGYCGSGMTWGRTTIETPRRGFILDPGSRAGMTHPPSPSLSGLTRQSRHQRFWTPVRNWDDTGSRGRRDCRVASLLAMTRLGGDNASPQDNGSAQADDTGELGCLTPLFANR